MAKHLKRILLDSEWLCRSGNVPAKGSGLTSMLCLKGNVSYTDTLSQVISAIINHGELYLIDPYIFLDECKMFNTYRFAGYFYYIHHQIDLSRHKQSLIPRSVGPVARQ